MRIMRLGLAGLLAFACSLAACVPPGGGGVNSASAVRACTSAATAAHDADQAATLAAPALVAIGLSQAKVDAIVAGIRRGELAITATCAIVQVIAAPPGGAAAGGSATVQPMGIIYMSAQSSI